MYKLMKVEKSYSQILDDNIFNEIELIAKRYMKAKNYFYSRYSGIKNIANLQGYIIRNNLVRENKLNPNTSVVSTFKLPARYWKNALIESKANIISNWSNLKTKLKRVMFQNQNLTNDDRYYLFYILKSDKLLYSILNHKPYNLSKNFNVNQIHLNKLLGRYIRKYKNNISYTTNKNSILLDADMYNYKKDGISIMGLHTGIRLFIPLKKGFKHYTKGDIRLIIHYDTKTIEIHKAVVVKSNFKNKSRKDNIIGIDKGYTSMIATSTGQEYGKQLGVISTIETNNINEKVTKRNYYYDLVRKCENNKDFEKAKRIRENNLGLKKYKNQRRKRKEHLKSYINHSLNEMIEKELPTEIIVEDLTFKSNNKLHNKTCNRKLNRWLKGYIQERLEYKCLQYNIKLHLVNPAYTSQICSVCSRFGVRQFKVFRCNYCNASYDADINASKNILKRYYDKDINLFTSYHNVKQILLNRISN